jgi:pimeloyl-ACP methyl ester carboxylesterase
MAHDTAGLLDHLELPQAHIVGASMGGMIAQTVAIEHPDRVRTLTSIMSTTGSRRLALPRLRALGTLLSRPPGDREAYADAVAKTFDVIGSPGYPRRPEYTRALALAAYDRCFYPAGTGRQLHAITASGDRTKALRRLRMPAAVIHGTKDPLVRTAAGRATAKAIPGASLHLIDGMGHDLPPGVWPRVIDAIAANVARNPVHSAPGV